MYHKNALKYAQTETNAMLTDQLWSWLSKRWATIEEPSGWSKANSNWTGKQRKTHIAIIIM